MATDNTIFLPPISVSESAVGQNGGPPSDNNVKVVAGWDGTNLHTLLTDNTGKLLISSGIPPLGQATMALSLPVAIASDQSPVPVSQSGTWNITNVSGTISLPTGAATSTLQTSGNASLTSIDGKVATAANQASELAFLGSIDSKLTDVATGTNQATEITALHAIQASVAGTLTVTGTVAVSNFPATQPISAVSLPLPTGAATAANQATEIASLASIDSKLTSPLAISAAALPLPAGAATETTLAALNTKVVQLALGSQLQAASLAVTVASDQPPLPVTTGTVAATYGQNGRIGFNSISTSYQTVLTTSTNAKILFIGNSFDQGTIFVSLDGGITDNFALDPGQSISIDYATNGLHLAAGSIIQAQYAGNPPSSGQISVSTLG